MEDYYLDFSKGNPQLLDAIILKGERRFPDFPDLFESRSEYYHYITKLAEDGFISINRTNMEVRWIARKVYLISFLYLLHDSFKLKTELYANNLQNLGKIAMIYFHIYIDKRTLQRGYYYRTRKDFPFIRK